jgi:LmbE family N-acetylglucosaminyl deacetylase
MKILLLSPHTDDMELGAGGTIVKLIENKNEIYWVVFSTAEDSLPANLPKDTLLKEFINVIKSIGLKKDNYKIFNFKVRRLNDYRQEILEEMIKIRKNYSPELVIGPSLNDYHQDHQVVANEMIRAFKTTSSIISCELPWNHIVFNTQFFVKLEKKHIDKKIQILNNYKSQIRLQKKYFSHELIIGWAKMRGTQVNADYAEAFEVARWII